MPFEKEDYFYNIELNKNDVPAKVVLGSKTGKFVPNINMSKWKDEAWLNINFPVAVTTEQASISADKISQTIGNYTFKYYEKGDDVLEWEIILDQKSSTNKFVFNIDFPEGLEFWYQDSLENDYKKLVNPSLTLEEFLKTAFRPNNVVGSYAVYWNKNNNEYKTGKFCHLFAWESTDALGTKQHIPLNIDPVLKKLTISVDQDFLDNATYPVKLMGMGDTFGFTTAGGSYDSNYNIDRAWSLGSAPTGTTSVIHGWIGKFGAATYHMKLGLYDDDSGPDNRLATAVEITLSGAQIFPAEDKSANYIASLAGGTIWFCKNSDDSSGNIFIMYDSVGGTPYVDNNVAYASSMPDPWGGTDATHDRKLSIWVDYTAGGGFIPYPLGDRRGARGGQKVLSGGLA